ncbi:MAG: hypothetical protein QG657_2646 [Acidobacteriota bacterium]|nr:hypothetical protein [Acidobacteriota bacterium]
MIIYILYFITEPKYLIKIDQADATLVNQIFFVIGKFEGNEKKFKALSIDKDVSFDENGISVAVTGKQYCIKETPVDIYASSAL